MYYKDTEVARNCNVFNDHQALSRIIDARRGTGRLQKLLDQIDRDFNVRGDRVRSALRLLGPLNPLGFLIKSVSSCISAYRNFTEIEQTRSKRTDILAKIRDLRNIVRVIPVVESDQAQPDSDSERHATSYGGQEKVASDE